MSKKILIITGKLFPTTGANVIIAKNIIEELLNREYEVIWISINQNDGISNISIANHDIPVYPIKSTAYARYLEQKKKTDCRT